MNVTHTLIDINACNAAGDKPVCLVDRGLAETWYVPSAPIAVKQQITWECYRQNNKVMIPLYPYITSMAPEVAMAFVFSLAFAAAAKLPATPGRLHIAIGTPVENVEREGQSCLQLWLGFAFH